MITNLFVTADDGFFVNLAILYGQCFSVQTPHLMSDLTPSRIIAPASSPMVPSIARSL
jgi:hypothetical protein